MTERIYVDNAATTKVAPEVLEAMLPYFTQDYGNPSSIYAEGRKAKSAIEHAREQVAAAIGADQGNLLYRLGQRGGQLGYPLNREGA